MPMRNPFKKAGAAHDENERPSSSSGPDKGFEQAQVVGQKPTPALSIRKPQDQPAEYKMSVVNEGVYLPPSPPEKRPFWHRSNSSTTSSNHRSMLGENEPFSISRESFDSYRRSFDISARSPIPQPYPTPPRQSLDSRRSRLPHTSSHERNFDQEPPTAEEGFEDVGLNDDVKPKKRSLFSRFAESSDANAAPSPGPGPSHHSFSFTGRKRGQSGQGAELGKIDRQSQPETPESTKAP
ncbi:MAG: hypothetical protein M1833_005393 [Piccolia ochrophora]|nr:MAG: hypothetical protein M1833_005393 [Piccolia ochrophora]